MRAWMTARHRAAVEEKMANAIGCDSARPSCEPASGRLAGGRKGGRHMGLSRRQLNRDGSQAEPNKIAKWFHQIVCIIIFHKNGIKKKYDWKGQQGSGVDQQFFCCLFFLYFLFLFGVWINFRQLQIKFMQVGELTVDLNFLFISFFLFYCGVDLMRGTIMDEIAIFFHLSPFIYGNG